MDTVSVGPKANSRLKVVSKPPAQRLILIDLEAMWVKKGKKRPWDILQIVFLWYELVVAWTMRGLRCFEGKKKKKGRQNRGKWRNTGRGKKKNKGHYIEIMI